MKDPRPLKCSIRAQDNGVTRVDIMDDIGGGGWFGDGLTAKAFADQMTKVKGPLDVHVSSSGGDVFDGVAIGNTIRNHKGFKRTINDGIAASIASVIFQAGDERIVQAGSMLMIHDAFGAAVGNAAEMAKMSQTLDQVSDNLAEVYASRAGGTQQSWRDAMREETWYTAEEAVAAGLADRVGDGEAELPAGLDLAAFQAVPGRIAAKLRAMPQAKAPVIVDADGNHAPMSGSHAHGHPAYGSQGSDSSHSHDHAHDGDASHNHSHAAADHAPKIQGDAQGPCCSMCGPDCACVGQPAAHLNAAGGSYMHGDHVRVDPDGDGDCDACAEGDTDHDYWDEDGNQIKPLPAGSGNAAPRTLEAMIREAVAAVLADSGGVDNSAWDASKAWHNGATADDPAAFYKGICAGRKDGDPSNQSSWALPYKYTPGSPPNAAGVRNALARLDQTQGLTNHDEAKALLQRLMKRINPDYDPAGDHAPPDLTGIDLEQIRAALRGANE